MEEYTASIESDYYYTYYEVAEKKEEFEKSFSSLMQLYEEWDIPGLEDHYRTTTENAGSASSSGAAQTSVSDSASGQSAGEGQADGRRPGRERQPYFGKRLQQADRLQYAG